MVKGTYKYVPPEMLEELFQIKKDYGVKKDADCFRLLAKSSRIGRELNFLLKGKK